MTVVIVADQAIYAKAQQIRSGNEYRGRLFCAWEEFHTLTAFIAALGEGLIYFSLIYLWLFLHVLKYLFIVIHLIVCVVIQSCSR